MQGEKTGVLKPDEAAARRTDCRSDAGERNDRKSPSMLWINMRRWPCFAIAVNEVLLTADSAVAGQLATQFQPVEIVADWPGDMLHWPSETIANLSGFIGKSYSDAPALLLGLSVVVLVPLFVIAGLVLRRSQLAMEPGRTMKYPAARKAPAANPPPQTLKLPVLGDASVTIQEGFSSEVAEHRFNGTLMVRIGREEDNDVQLSDPTVHRYHAVISRSADAGFVVSDLSSSDGNGVIVNGKRVRRQRLNDGDIITLGTAKLTFRLQ